MRETTNECEGACFINEDCKGEVVSVVIEKGDNVPWVWDKPLDFNYCQTAIEKDRETGYIVTIIQKGLTRGE